MKLSNLVLGAFASFSSFTSVHANADTEGTDADVSIIEIVGNHFYYKTNGSEFYIKGIAYQQDTANSTDDSSFVDPLSDYETCERDLPYLTELHTNVLRVYAVNTSLSHKACMDLFAENGIYIIADLSEPSLSINRDDPAWTLELYNRYTDVIDAFSNYTNVLGFFAGNEVSNEASNTAASAFVKAAVRDMKSYISDQGYRDFPVGYSTNDDSETRVKMANYFVCGDSDVKVDFYGINMYEWCGNSTFEESGYEARTEEFKNLSIPLFFSEYGCNSVQPREFTEVGTIYSDDMTDVWSGGIVYMYFEESNNYGLVTIKDDEVSTLADFHYLKTELGDISPTTATAASSEATTTSLSCPSQDSYWHANTALPPTPDKDVCDCLEASLSCVVSSDVSSDDYSDLYSTVCGYIDCSDITANGTTGEYGAYSYCNSDTKLSYLLNKYYLDQDSASTACDFDSSATLTGSGSATGTCSALLSEAIESASASDADDDSTSTDDSSSSTSGSSSSDSSTTSASGLAVNGPSPVSSSTLTTMWLVASVLFGGLGFAVY